jgi:hypothetical protein
MEEAGMIEDLKKERYERGEIDCKEDLKISNKNKAGGLKEKHGGDVEGEGEGDDDHNKTIESITEDIELF